MLITGSLFSDMNRKTVHLEDIAAFPIHPFEQLSKTQRNQVSELTCTIADNSSNWTAIDNWVEDLYGLTSADRELIADAIDVSLPFDACRRLAQQSPTNEQVKRFAEALEADLSPFFSSADAPLYVQEIRSHLDMPWRFLKLYRSHDGGSSDGDSLIRTAITTAGSHGASRILWENDGRLILGLLKQYRYWTPTQARLCALGLIQSTDRTLDGQDRIAV